MTYKELYSTLNELFPTAFSAKWDNDGDMLCLFPDAQINKILISLDVNMPVIERAINSGYDLIISHHPLIFSPVRRINYNDIVSCRLLALIKSGIQVMSFHTRLDCVAVNEELAKALCLSDVRPFDFDALPMGRIGVLPRAMYAEELAEYIKCKLGAPNIVFPSYTRPVQKLALLGGGGCSAALSAKSAGADALLTGDYSYNSVIDFGESNFPVFAAGHFYTENPVCEFLKRTVEEICPGTITEIYNSNILNSL